MSKKIFLFIFILGASAAILIFWSVKQKNNLSGSFVIINNHQIEVEIADTPERQRQGLSKRESLPENSCLLFIFLEKQYQVFWMKEMRFPIDII